MRPARYRLSGRYQDYLGTGGVYIAVLNDKDNWKREDVWRDINDGETYTTQFKAPCAGRWKMVARLDNQYIHSVVEVDAGEAFTFTPPPKQEYAPSKWLLDNIVLYLWDRTDKTPEELRTLMDVYRVASEGRREGGE